MRTNLIRLFNWPVMALLLALFAASCFGQTASGGDVVMVLPFENTSNHPEYNWVGESFADSLAELLNKPGLLVVSSDERELAYQRLRLPETVIPSRATAIKLARGERIDAKDKVNNGKIDVPSILQEPIVLDKNNVMQTVIKDGYHKMEDVYKNVPKDQWPKQ